MKHVTSNKTT